MSNQALDTGVHLYLKGKAIHDCRSCQKGPALYQALRDTILAVPDRHLETERKLASAARRLDELREAPGKPFEHEERLTALLWRQRALATELDLVKDEAGTQGLEASEESLAACLTLQFRPHRICGGADCLRRTQVAEAAVDGTGIVVARSMCRSRFDDLHCLTTNDGAD